MNDHIQVDRAVAPRPIITKAALMKARWSLWGLALGLVAGAWIGGGPDRFGEEEGIVGGLRGAGRSMAKSFRYTAATFRDCVANEGTSVRRLGLGQQLETRLWQDKRLVAEGIIVEIGEGGTAVLRGIVPDEGHKEKAVSLARDTRGVERVVDQLAVGTSSRTIDAAPAAAVPTGVASGSRILR